MKDQGGGLRAFLNRPFQQLVLTRVMAFLREPEAIFWGYGFPTILVVALGIAFRNKPVELVRVCVEPAGIPAAFMAAVAQDPRMRVVHENADLCREQLRLGRADLMVTGGPSTGFQVTVDPTRPESALARAVAADAFQAAAGQRPLVPMTVTEVTEPGSRYVDFLIPGLIGFSIMGGGLWGVGFAVADMRMRKLLKKMRATPMNRGHFLGAIAVSRLMFLLPETAVLLLFSRLFFGVECRGSYLGLLLLCVTGSFAFSGIGLLVGSRTRTMEGIMGLINLVSMPMWILSGVFFAKDRFPEVLHPFLNFLPLTPLIDGMRAVMIEGAGGAVLWQTVGIMMVWCVASFGLALRLFRWT